MCNKQTSNDNKVCLYDCDIVVFDRLNTHLVGFDSQNMLRKKREEKNALSEKVYLKKGAKYLHFISAVVMVFRPGADGKADVIIRSSINKTIRIRCLTQ